MVFRKGPLEDLVMISQGFWKDKTVFITGHTGFKGSWLSLWLHSLGAKVIGYALEVPTHPSLFHDLKLEQLITSLNGDIRDSSTLIASVKQYQPDIVIHMAAQPLVKYSYQNPVETYDVNVMGTVNLLEAARLSRPRAVLIVTTDKCYQNNEWVWGYRENEPMGGHDPYSSSKGCAELITAAYRSSFFSPETYSEHGVAVASARAGNVIGGGDWAKDRLIPDLIRGFINNESVPIRYPYAVRPWQHVLEPLSGYVGGWNFGPFDQDARPVSWIADKMVSLWGEGASWSKDKADHPHEATYLKLDCSKATTYLNWSPRWNLGEALHHIAHWYRTCHLEGHEVVRRVTLETIMEFTNPSL
jgi:CDP-glucose 4,6-dehydratase